MKSFMLMAFLVFSYAAGAETSGDSIHSIVRGKVGEPHLIKFNSGAVHFIEHDEQHKLAVFEAKLKPQVQTKMLTLEENTEFEPSVVPDSEIAAIFKRMNPYMRRKSECSDRAHVWAWDEFQKSGTKSEKAFLLLTDTYIKRNRYKWWFHVAPMYTTASGKKIVMDHQFLDRPVTFTEWKNFLVFSKRECVTDFRFLDYDAGADQTQDCYIKFEPMYYFIPGDIGARESGRGRTGWSNSEVNASRSRAFFQGSL
ncbi:MAG: protein-glutamine glutaminase family protein [Bacteriovoracaceae bacterium]|nr:protein-glutamine glutaminase family protein [Bacteriovoracaceae bacterium]